MELPKPFRSFLSPPPLPLFPLSRRAETCLTLSAARLRTAIFSYLPFLPSSIHQPTTVLSSNSSPYCNTVHITLPPSCHRPQAEQRQGALVTLIGLGQWRTLRAWPGLLARLLAHIRQRREGGREGGRERYTLQGITAAGLAHCLLYASAIIGPHGITSYFSLSNLGGNGFQGGFRSVCGAALSAE